MTEIKNIKAREILDSRGNPTVEVDVVTNKGLSRASVPSGASTGIHESLELRDNDKRFLGKGVLKAVNNVNNIIAKKLIGYDCTKQKEVDELMIDLDGTPNKSNLGANAILGVSMAVCKAAALSNNVSLYRYISNITGNSKFLLPVPMIVILEGGKHGDESTDFQEFMIMPNGAPSFREALRYATEIYLTLKNVLKKKHHHVNVGLEGAFTPNLKSNIEAIELILEAINEAGYEVKKEISVALDVASSEFFDNGKYVLKREGKVLNSDEMIDYYEDLAKTLPIISIEDGMAEDDWNGWQSLNQKLGNRIQIVGDDLIVTNIKRIRRAIELNAINSALIKINQIGTITETIDAVKILSDNKFIPIVSHRGGSTGETFISDFVVGLGTGQCKFGAPARGERTSKYNQLLRIEEELGNKAKYSAFN